MVSLQKSAGPLQRDRSLILFLFFWLAFGAATNVRTQRNYNLQQMGVDAIVQHHTFTLGHNPLPVMRPAPGKDTFWFNGQILAAKQPGQFVFGAIPYFVIRSLGITYENDYDLAASLVTWFSTGLFAALALVLLDITMQRLWGFSGIASMLATLMLGASGWFCYAGVAHHDMLAGSLLVFALFAIELNRYRHEGRNLWLALAAGALLGLVVFTSMLPALIVVVLGAYVLWTLPFPASLWHAAGFAIGLLPLLAYNGWYFGNPFVPPNVAGNFSDTFFRWNAKLWASHLNTYLGTGGLSLWRYAPGLALGLIGIVFLPLPLRYLVGTAVIVHLFYLTHIETLGGCQYGPRYLLPLLPLLAPGLAVLLDRPTPPPSTSKKLLAGALLAYGFVVNLTGALRGTMYCGNLGEFAFSQQFGMDQPNGRRLTQLVVYVALAAVSIWVWRRFVSDKPVNSIPPARRKTRRPPRS